MKNFLYELGCQDNGVYTIKVNGEVPLPRLKDTDRIIIPADEGIAVPVNQKAPFSIENVILCRREGTMSMVIIERGDVYLLVSPEMGIYASYSLLWNGSQNVLSMKTNKEMCVRYGVYSSLKDACKAYRSMLKEELVPLTKKNENLPELQKLIGGAIFWIWNDRYQEVMYAEQNTDLNPAVGKPILTVAEDLHKNGIDNAMVGIFFDSDGEFVEPLYKEHGYICTQYDNYSDVLKSELLDKVPSNRLRNCDYTARRVKDYPEGIQIDKDGKMEEAWAIKGFDGTYYAQNTLCPQVAADRMREEIPEVLKKYPYYKGRFVDVFGVSLSECFSEEHPLTFEQCREVKNGAYQSIMDMGLITGTEDGSEAMVNTLCYTEGLHSPSYLRNYDSGRRYAYLYTEEECEHLKNYMLNPKWRVPLWHLVYHENLLSFPYWGDSTCCAPEYLKDKILFSCLFGCAPLYSFFLKNYETVKPYILESYEKITKVHEKIACLPMTDYQVLTNDYSVQTTVFGDRYRVVANFGETDFVYEGKMVKSKDLLFYEQ
ncbi:MAG: hypothetical protein IKJ55_04525 [Clostridia bacterium]|nr:hypothetical protein [Clostridia bacterium]